MGRVSNFESQQSNVIKQTLDRTNFSNNVTQYDEQIKDEQLKI